jgi:hypothetical protein
MSFPSTPPVCVAIVVACVLVSAVAGVFIAVAAQHIDHTAKRVRRRAGWGSNPLSSTGGPFPRRASNCAQRWCGSCQGRAAARSAPGRALTATAPPRERPLPARGVVWCGVVLNGSRCGDHASLTISSSLIRRLWSSGNEN